MLGPWKTHLKRFFYDDFVSDNDWFIWKYLNGFLLFKINFLMFMGKHIKYLVKV
jgi:hypothetical protein